ncbi:MAG TPA: glycosyl transferase, partial [Arthrobacter sp.]
MSLARQHISVLGVDATPLKVDELIEVLAGFVAEGTKRSVVGHNLHSVTLTHSDAGFRSLYEHSDVVLI